MAPDFIKHLVDLEDEWQFPIEGQRVRHPAYPNLVSKGQDQSNFQAFGFDGDREFYHSFAQCLDAEVPPHYRQYYIGYEDCKRLIGNIIIANEAVLKGQKIAPTVPSSTRRLVEERVQALIGANASKIDELTVRKLIPEMTFREFLNEQLEKVNQFSSLRYHEVEQDIRGICRRFRDLIETDKIRLSSSVTGNKESQVPAASSTVHWTSQNGSTSPHSILPTLIPPLNSRSYSLSSSSPLSSSVPTSRVSMSDSEYDEWRLRALIELEEALEEQSAEIIHLDMYIRFNYKGFLRLSHIFDRVRTILHCVLKYGPMW